TLLIDVDRIGQQREHQALFAGQAMAAGEVKILAGKNLIAADETFGRGIETQLQAFRHLPHPPGSRPHRERIRVAPDRTLIERDETVPARSVNHRAYPLVPEGDSRWHRKSAS